jgi:hypothetical protein
MRRHRRSVAAVGAESLIDVMSNTVGALMLLCVLATLKASDLRWQLFISEERAADTEPASYVVRGDRIRRFDPARLGAIVDRLPAGHHEIPADTALPFRVVLDKGRDGDATIRLVDEPGLPGEPLADLSRAGSPIGSELRQLDGRRRHVFFYLGSDAFDQYISLRSLCRSLGLQVGWTPAGLPLEFRYARAGTGSVSPRQLIDVGR